MGSMTLQEIRKDQMASIFTIEVLTIDGRNSMERVLNAARVFSCVLIEEVPEDNHLQSSLDQLRLCVDMARHGIGDNDFRNRRAASFRREDDEAAATFEKCSTLICGQCGKKSRDINGLKFCGHCGSPLADTRKMSDEEQP
jgi:hypothetical protein